MYMQVDIYKVTELLPGPVRVLASAVSSLHFCNWSSCAGTMANIADHVQHYLELYVTFQDHEDLASGSSVQMRGSVRVRVLQPCDAASTRCTHKLHMTSYGISFCNADMDKKLCWSFCRLGWRRYVGSEMEAGL
jgi:hypothetical protein